MSNIMEHFSIIKDPRRAGYSKKYDLIDIIGMAICAVISGANNWVEVTIHAES